MTFQSFLTADILHLCNLYLNIMNTELHNWVLDSSSPLHFVLYKTKSCSHHSFVTEWPLMAVTYSSSPRDTNLSGIEVVSTSRWCLNVHNYDSQLIGIQLEHTFIFVQSCFSKWYISLASNFVLPFLYTTGLICSCYFQYHSHVVDQSIWNSDIYISEVQMASGGRVKKEDQQSENRTNREYDHQPETSINCQRSWTAARV